MDGVANQAVIELILARQAGRRDDNARLGLAVEGGGMRGIVTGGMVLALKDLGLLDAFDAFYGTSSGSMNLVYSLGGADWDGLSVYYDHLTRGFVRRKKRWDVRQPVLDMDYAFDEVMTRTVPIGWQQIRTLDSPLYAVLSDVDAVRCELLDVRTLGPDGIAYLKAGAWMPWLAGPPPVVDGTRYIDGGLLCPDPVYAAIDDGCTHVLLLNSSPSGKWPAVPRSRPLIKSVLNRWQTGLGDQYLAARIRWDADRAHARFDRDVSMGEAIVRRLATPEGAHHISPLTHRRDALLDGAKAGYQAITDLFAGDGRRPYFSFSLR